MKKILFIHGFASSGKSQKVNDLAKMLECEVIAPDLSHQPTQDIQLLENIIGKNTIEIIVGSSLGGFYALLLASRFPHKLLLINPSLTPHITLMDKIGDVESFKGASFEWSMQEIDALATLAQEISLETEPNINLQSSLDKTLILLAKNDERLNHKDTLKYLNRAYIVVDDQQDHRFADITAYAEQIKKLYLA